MVWVGGIEDWIMRCFNDIDNLSGIHGSKMVSSGCFGWEATDLAEWSLLKPENRLDRLPFDDNDRDRPRGDLDGDCLAAGEPGSVHRSATVGCVADLRR